MKKFTLLLAIVSMIVCFAAVTVYAGNDFSSASVVYVDTTISGSTSGYDHVEYYQFTINYPAILSFPATWWSDGETIYFDLYDSNLEYVEFWYYDGSVETESVVLSAGTYYLEVSLYDNDASYEFSIDYEPLTETVPETMTNSNDTIQNADIVHMNKIYYGVMTEDDDYDYYKFYVSEPMNIMLMYADADDCYVRITDENEYYLYEYSSDTDGDVVTKLYEVEEEGTYYLRISSYNYAAYEFAILDGSTYNIGDAPIRPRNNKVTVSIPDFPVRINGVYKDNTYAKYPYIVYNDITYCPMTFHGARFLGLNSTWVRGRGTSITKLEGGSIGDGDNTYGSRNSGTYTAAITEDFIRVNGKEIDNFAETYPILIFRDVTYFPLTWRFAVTEFGWDYNYTRHGGLVVNSR